MTLVKYKVNTKMFHFIPGPVVLSSQQTGSIIDDLFNFMLTPIKFSHFKHLVEPSVLVKCENLIFLIFF